MVYKDCCDVHWYTRTVVTTKLTLEVVGGKLSVFLGDNTMISSIKPVLLRYEVYYN